ncbi:MAG: TadE family protein [Terriglobia bacterium]
MIAASKRRSANADGQALVEFVLSILFVVLLIFGILEFLMFIYTYNVLADSAKEGVRYAIVHGTGNLNCSGPGGGGVTCSDSGNANVAAAVKNYAQYSFHNPADMTITVNYPDSSSAAPARVRVVVTYPYEPFFGLGWPKVTVRAAAEARIMD